MKDTRGVDIAYGWKGKGSTVHLVTEGEGLPLALEVTAANVSEVTIAVKVVDKVRVPRPRGRPRKRPARLSADKGYDSSEVRQELRMRGIRPYIPHRRLRDTTGGCWKVERTHGWLDNWRRLVTRYDWYTDSYIAFVTIACFMVCLSRLTEK